MRRKNTEPLKAVLQRYLRAIGADKKLKEIRLVNQWEEIIGRNIARLTENLYIKNGILHLFLKSPVAKHEILLIKKGIIERMNKAAGEKIIYDIKVY